MWTEALSGIVWIERSLRLKLKTFGKHQDWSIQIRSKSCFLPGWEELLCAVCLVPRRLSRVRKGRREGDNGRDCLPSVPFPWSLAAHHQSLASTLRKTKRLRRRLSAQYCTVQPWYNEPLFNGQYNKVLGITMFFSSVIVNTRIRTKPSNTKQILPIPWPLVMSNFHRKWL